MQNAVITTAPDANYVFTPEDGSERVFFEPLTAGAVIGMIASLASSYASGQQLKQLFAGQATDIDNMINAAVSRMEAIVNEAMDRQTVGVCQGQINSCRTLLREFENSPKQDYRLHLAVGSSSDSLKVLNQLGWRQFEPYGDAASVRMLALCVSLKHHHQKGDLISLRECAIESLAVLDQYTLDAGRYMQSLVDGISEIRFRDTLRHDRFTGRGDYQDVVITWETKGYFYNNGVEENVIVFAQTEEDAKVQARDNLQGPRAAAIKKRQDEAENLDNKLRLYRNIRAAEWKKCCDIVSTGVNP